jgi:ribA/ribD-fused uncharacterized protein
MKVKGFDEEEWERVARDLMAKALDAKFDSDVKLRRKLLATGHGEIAEARRDYRWGIGLMPAKSCQVGRSKWGKNWLGQQLVRTRNRLAENTSTAEGDQSSADNSKDNKE